MKPVTFDAAKVEHTIQVPSTLEEAKQIYGEKWVLELFERGLVSMLRPKVIEWAAAGQDVAAMALEFRPVDRIQAAKIRKIKEVYVTMTQDDKNEFLKSIGKGR